MVLYRNVNMPVYILGIDTTKHCGPLSNIDLVHFVWENFIRFSYKKICFGPFASRLSTARIGVFETLQG